MVVQVLCAFLPNCVLGGQLGAKPWAAKIVGTRSAPSIPTGGFWTPGQPHSFLWGLFKHQVNPIHIPMLSDFFREKSSQP